MKLKEIMNKYPVTVSPDTTTYEVARLLVKHNVTAIPVVVDDGRLAGIITEGDLLYKKVRPHAPHYVNLLGASVYYGGMGEYNEQFRKLLATKVSELMTKDVIFGLAETDVEDMAAVMVEQHLKVVPVVEGKRLIGTVGRHDIMRLIASEAPPETEEEETVENN